MRFAQMMLRFAQTEGAYTVGQRTGVEIFSCTRAHPCGFAASPLPERGIMKYVRERTEAFPGGGRGTVVHGG